MISNTRFNPAVFALLTDEKECVITNLNMSYIETQTVYPIGSPFEPKVLVEGDEMFLQDTFQQTNPLNCEISMDAVISMDLASKIMFALDGSPPEIKKVSQKQVKDCTVKELLFAAKKQLDKNENN